MWSKSKAHELGLVHRGDLAALVQSVYDAANEVGQIKLFGTTTDPNDQAAALGVSATWVELTDDDHYLRVHSSATPLATGGSATAPLPNHVHPFSDSLGVTTVPSTPNEVAVVNDTSVGGNTGNPATQPNINITPLFVNVRAWRRSS